MIPNFNPETAAQRQQTTSVVRHEVGHLITARSQGFSTGRIKLQAQEAGAELDLTPSILAVSDLVSYVESRIRVLYAGSYAESISGGQVNSRKAVKFMQTTASNDFTKVRELLKILTGCACQNVSNDIFQKKMDEINNRLSNDAGRIVTANAKLIANMTVLFMKEYDKAVKISGFEPDLIELTKEEIDGYLKGKTIIS